MNDPIEDLFNTAYPNISNRVKMTKLKEELDVNNLPEIKNETYKNAYKIPQFKGIITEIQELHDYTRLRSIFLSIYSKKREDENIKKIIEFLIKLEIFRVQIIEAEQAKTITLKLQESYQILQYPLSQFNHKYNELLEKKEEDNALTTFNIDEIKT